MKDRLKDTVVFTISMYCIFYNIFYLLPTITSSKLSIFVIGIVDIILILVTVYLLVTILRMVKKYYVKLKNIIQGK